jgi:UDP-N-acetylglucosamine transferase subunit ALG13
MIFVTVGTQLPFDRLIQAIDEWAFRIDRNDVVAQIGPSDIIPKKIATMKFCAPGEFNRLFSAATVIIAHAGMGTIINAMMLSKPIIVVPRESSRGEHRNDHQLATARRMEKKTGIYVAQDENQLRKLLSRIEHLSPAFATSEFAEPRLISSLCEFLSKPLK